MFKGAFTALVTPFKDGEVDEAALRNYIEEQIAAGINGLVPCGSTGESATLTHEEHDRVIDITVETTAGRVPVIAGAGSNSTRETIKLTKHAADGGADAALLITPYYNKPSQAGLYEHFKTVAEECDIPIFLYNVPVRTAVNLSSETTARLSELPGIIGIKEATGNMEQISQTIRLSKDGFIVLSGDDASTLPLLSIGGSGVISVTSNIAPVDMSSLCSAFFSGDQEGARKIHEKLLPLSAAMFVETNPVPVKTALAMMGKITEEFRLPLVNIGESGRRAVEDALREYGIL